MIADRPDSAYDVCTKFAPNCYGQESSSALGAGSSATTRTSSSTIQSERGSRLRNEASSDQGSISSTFSGSRTNLDRGEQYGDRNSARNIGFSSVGLSSASSISLNTESTLSQDISGESDGLGAGYNGEDEYYDSINSGDENDSTNSGARLNRTRTATQIEPVYNYEPGLNENRQNENAGGATSESGNSAVSTNTSVFTTVINGVRMKSLPGPRGNSEDCFHDHNINR